MKIADVKPLPCIFSDDEQSMFIGPLCLTVDEFNRYMAEWRCGKECAGAWLTLLAWTNCKPQNIHWN